MSVHCEPPAAVSGRRRRALRVLVWTLVASGVGVATTLTALYVPQPLPDQALLAMVTVSFVSLIRPWRSWTRALLTIAAIVSLWFMVRSGNFTTLEGGCDANGLCY